MCVYIATYICIHIVFVYIMLTCVDKYVATRILYLYIYTFVHMNAHTIVFA